MSQEVLIERFFETLINGDRTNARKLVQECFSSGTAADEIIQDLFWPTHELIERLQRADQMSLVSYHLATRLLRTLVDQASARLQVPANKSHRILATCGPSQGEELGAQMAVDLLEAAGFDVTFTGGGIPADEIIAQVHERRPDVLLMFASAASDLPGIRQIVDHIREIRALPGLRIAVGGGVFNRAEGLAEELSIELFASNPRQLVSMLNGSSRKATTERRRLKAA